MACSPATPCSLSAQPSCLRMPRSSTATRPPPSMLACASLRHGIWSRPYTQRCASTSWLLHFWYAPIRSMRCRHQPGNASCPACGVDALIWHESDGCSLCSRLDVAAVADPDVCWQLLDFWPALRVWRSVHFLPLFLMGAVLLTNKVNPPRKRAPSQSRAAAGTSRSASKDPSANQQPDKSSAELGAGAGLVPAHNGLKSD